MIFSAIFNKFKHTFIPRESNNHKARLLHFSGLTILLLSIILVQTSLNLAQSANVKILGYAANISPSEVIRLTNEKRAENGLSPVQYNALLEKAAQEKGNDMINRNYWAHVAPDGTEPWSFFAKVGYKYRYAGENLARDFTNPEDAVNAWMASPSHRENMLSDKYKDIGVAVVEGDLSGTDTTIIVQLFGSLSADSISSVPVAAAKNQEPVPTSSPKPTSLPKAQKLAQVSESQIQKTISPFQIAKYFSIFIISVLIITLLLDLLIIEHKKVARISGKTLAHISFIGMILAILLIAKAGQIF